MNLRSYQRACIEAQSSALDRGIRRQLNVLATGLGKSVILAASVAARGGRTLVIGHRDHLTIQNGRKLVAMNPDANVAIEQDAIASRTGAYCNGDEDIILSSVQTLSRNECKRLKRLLRYGYFDRLIIDEAHHSLAATYQAIISECANANPDFTLEGYTATPKPNSKTPLGKVYQEVVFNMTLRDGIEQGWLVDIVADEIVTTTSLDGIDVVKGDYATGQLSKTINTPERNALIVNGWLQHAPGEPTIVFAHDVQHARDLTDAFNRADVAAEMIIGETDDYVRRAILYRYEEDRTNVLINVDVFTEGFDSPKTRCITDASPTMSQLRYIQRIGRGTRPIEELTDEMASDGRRKALQESEKPFLHLLAVADNAKKHSPVMLADLFGVPKTLKLKKTPVVEAVKKIERALHEAPSLQIDKVKSIDDLPKMVTKALRIKIWDIEPPKEVKEHSRFTWQKQGDEYHLQLDKHETLLIQTNQLGQFEAVLKTDADFDGEKWNARETQFEVLGHEESLDKIFKRSDSWTEKSYPDKVVLLNQSAKWHKDIASDKQINLLRKFRHNIRVENGEPKIHDGDKWVPLRKGLAHALIGKALDKKGSAPNPKPQSIPSTPVRTHVLKRRAIAA